MGTAYLNFLDGTPEIPGYAISAGEADLVLA
jgi:hypothetical protein